MTTGPVGKEQKTPEKAFHCVKKFIAGPETLRLPQEKSSINPYAFANGSLLFEA